MMSEPMITSEDGTPPIETPVTPSETNPLPLIVVMVPGQAPPPAVTMSGVAPFPPIQLVIVTAPADPEGTAPSTSSPERQAAFRTQIRMEAFPLTREPSLSSNRLAILGNTSRNYHARVAGTIFLEIWTIFWQSIDTDDSDSAPATSIDGKDALERLARIGGAP